MIAGSAVPNSTAVTLMLVRHARAGSRSRWIGDDRDRPLTKKGRAQADALPELLAPYLTTGRRRPLLLSSPWVRCIETLAPLAASTAATIKEEAVLGEGEGSHAVAQVEAWLTARPTVLCTHGDVILEVLSYLTRMGIAVGPDPKMPKASVWVLDGQPGTISSARYLPPPV